VKNVGHQFYNGAEETIIVILRELSNQKCYSFVYTICDHFVSNLISFVTTQTDVSPLWKSFMVGSFIEEYDRLLGAD